MQTKSEAPNMSDLQWTSAQIKTVQESIGLTRERSERELGNSDSDVFDVMEGICDYLLKGGDVVTFLEGVDFEVPSPVVGGPTSLLAGTILLVSNVHVR